MQRLRANIALRAVRQLPLAPAVHTLPGLKQLAVPACLCTLSGSLPSISNSEAVSNSFTNLRGFAAEACRVDDQPVASEDQQADAEALFKRPDNFPAPTHQPEVFPFNARAYYVGESCESNVRRQ